MLSKVLAIAAIAACAASAHLGAVTAPKAGESYAPGATVNVKWAVSVPHGGQDLAYSQDGRTWTNITTTPLGARINSYTWTVPNKPSATTRLRVCQRSNGTCTDAHNTNALSNSIAGNGGDVYVALTGNFTIDEPTGVLASASAAAPRIQYNAFARNVELTFSMDKAGPVVLQAFDLKGNLLATLLDTEKAEGRHVLSVFSNALPVSKMTVLRLQAGSHAMDQLIGSVR